MLKNNLKQKAHFMATDTDLVGEKQPFLMNTSYLNKANIKFLQIIQDTIRQICS